MKNKKVFLYYVSFYIIGNVIFNLIFSIVKTIIINYIGGHEILIENLAIAFKETFLIYTIIFIFLLIAFVIYNKNIVRELNKKLNKIKERSDENEK